MARPNGFSELWKFVRGRIRVGLRRMSSSVLTAIQITVGGVGAYIFAEYILGHEGPIFAATSALISLGFSRDPRIRRVVEVSVGCTLGIAVGDTLLHVLGNGIWQAAVVLFISLMLARFLDRGTIFTTQLGLQSLLVVLLPAPADGPFARSTDAIVGGLVALLITVLAPRDPRSEPKADVTRVFNEFSMVLRETASALHRSDSTLAWHALIRARNCQPLMDALTASLRSAQEMATLSVAYRRHRDELANLRTSLEYVDLAIRNSRVFARRLTSVINHAALSDDALTAIGDLVEETADAVDVLSAALSGSDPGERAYRLRRARTDLAAIATRLHPRQLSASGLEAEGFVLLFRPLIVDLMQAAGIGHDEAAGYLPKL